MRKCDCLVNTDFGGEQGGENCPFYRKRKHKEKAADCLQQPTAKEIYRTYIIDGITHDVKKGNIL